MSQVSIAKWGNSLALRIPKNVADLAGWHAGDIVEFMPQQDAMLIKKTRNIKKYRLSETIGSYHSAEETEFDWGKPVGREIW